MSGATGMGAAPTGDGVSEKSSEPSRKGRKPRVPTDGLLAMGTALFAEESAAKLTPRTRHDHTYAMTARLLLMDQPDYEQRYAWLLRRRSLLAGLGRLYAAGAPTDHLTMWADKLCAERPPVRGGIRFLRSLRRPPKELPPGDSQELVGGLLAVLNEYAATHAVDQDFLAAALSGIGDAGKPLVVPVSKYVEAQQRIAELLAISEDSSEMYPWACEDEAPI